jgi:phospholipase/carboxylesterase
MAGEVSYVIRQPVGTDRSTRLPLVVAIHGLGDRPEKFAFVYRKAHLKARLIFVRGLDPYGPGFSWFPISGLTGDPEKLSASLRTSATKVHQAIVELQKQFPTAGKPIVTGFSQGGMLSFTLAVMFPDSLYASLPLAGYLPKPLVPQRGKLSGKWPTVIAYHGQEDKRLPLTPTKASVSEMNKQGYPVTLKEYPGVPHSIGKDEYKDYIQQLTKFISELENLPKK